MVTLGGAAYGNVGRGSVWQHWEGQCMVTSGGGNVW